MTQNNPTICCLNPQCLRPENKITVNFCINCGQPLITALRQRYRPIKLLSDEGGFGRTYLAEDTDKLNQLCVIKQFVPQVSGSSALKKAQELFEQEAQQLQQIGEHPQIPSLLAYFEEENYLYLIQQYIPGITLNQELINRKKPYNETEIRQFLEDILPVLKFIHDQKLIHRDIKPANIMRLTQNISKLGGKVGQYVLIDFGASKDLANTVTNRGTQIGTNGYSPREQLLEGKAYPCSDLYSLGTTCFYLLTNVEPYNLFVDNGYVWVDKWQKHLSQTISNELILVVTKLLNKDHQNRYQSADEVMAALNINIPQNPVKTTLQTPNKFSFNLNKNKIFALLISIFCLISVPIIGYKIYENNFQLSLETKNISLIQTINNQDRILSVAISPDIHTLVSGNWNNTIKVWNLSTGELLHTLTGHQDSVNSLVISSDNNTLYSGSNDATIKIWDLQTGKLTNTFLAHKYSIESIAISSDNNILVTGSSDKTIKIWNLQTGELLHTLTDHTASLRSVTISSDNRILVSGSNDKTIKIWNLQTGELLNTIIAHEAPVRAVKISSDNRILVSCSDDKKIKIWDFKTGKLSRILEGHENPVDSLAITPDNRILVSGSWKDLKIWNLKTGELLRTINDHQDSIFSLAISSDGKTLVSGSADKTIKIWGSRAL